MEACEYYTSVKADGRKGLDQFVYNRLHDLQPTIGHYIACSFPWKAIITTNFNQVAENAWKTGNNEGFAYDEMVPIVIDSDIHNLTNSATRLYKPHGCISFISGKHQQENRIVLTSKDYFVSEEIRHEIYKDIINIITLCF